MKITKILALLLVVVMSLSFVSCGDLLKSILPGGEESDTESQTVAESDSNETETDKKQDDDKDEEEDDDDDLLGDLGGDTDGEKLPDGQVIYFEDFQKYGNTTIARLLRLLVGEK